MKQRNKQKQRFESRNIQLLFWITIFKAWFLHGLCPFWITFTIDSFYQLILNFPSLYSEEEPFTEFPF